MAMITCGECEKNISNKAAVCIGCGAPVATMQLAVPPNASVISTDDAEGDWKNSLNKTKGEFDEGETVVEKSNEERGREILQGKGFKLTMFWIIAVILFVVVAPLAAIGFIILSAAISVIKKNI